MVGWGTVWEAEEGSRRGEVRGVTAVHGVTQAGIVSLPWRRVAPQQPAGLVWCERRALRSDARWFVCFVSWIKVTCICTCLMSCDAVKIIIMDDR